ncbi:MAG: hypothetical protein R2816_00775 [Flavobacteriaceae bacterium]|nr:hypothetical protein [Flavobacteriaceae bacterium]
MKRSIITILLCGFVFACFGQKVTDSIPQNKSTYLFFDFSQGVVVGDINGFGYGLSGNYQNNKDLFSIRTNYIFEFSDIWATLFQNKEGTSINEYALLYGKRFVFNDSSLSISIGISSNLWKYDAKENDTKVVKRKSYIGLPIEITGLGFDKKAEKMGILIGAKLFSNIGKASYVGIAINFSIGKHKRH